jgi:hypothetical protein
MGSSDGDHHIQIATSDDVVLVAPVLRGCVLQGEDGRCNGGTVLRGEQSVFEKELPLSESDLYGVKKVRVLIHPVIYREYPACISTRICSPICGVKIVGLPMGFFFGTFLAAFFAVGFFFIALE